MIKVTTIESSIGNARVWHAYIHIGETLHTFARGRDQGAALADAVAMFRTARGCRKAG